jgi:hypothetical protein
LLTSIGYLKLKLAGRLDMGKSIPYVLVMFNDDPTLIRHRDALAGIVAMLVAMIGLADGTVVERIGLGVRLRVLRILRPAEAAVRRLIYVAARGVEAKPVVRKPAAFFRGLANASPATARPSRPRFQLSDPMVPMMERPPVFRARVRWIAPIDPTIPAFIATRRSPVQKPDIDVVRAQSLVCRLRAIADALHNIPRQAKRLVRWTARRERIAEQRPVYTSPLRAGPPPGYRKEPVHEVDRILYACHLRAFDARFK